MSKRVVILSELALLAAGLIWGGNAAVLKGSLDMMPPNWLVVFRSTISAILMFLVFGRRIRFQKASILFGVLSGFLLWGATLLQMVGLAITTASNTSFLTSTKAAWVPLIYWLVARRRPKFYQIGACLLCMVGIGLVAVDGGLQIQLGDMFVLGGAVLFGAQIVCANIGTVRHRADALEMTCWQFLFIGVFSLPAALLFDDPLPVAQIFSDSTLIGALLYSGVACGFLACVLQNVGLKHAPVAHASLLLATEAPFGCFLAMLLLGERLTLRTGIGFLLIIGVIVFSEIMKNRERESAKEPTVSA